MKRNTEKYVNEFRLADNHFPIETGIPIPEKDLFVKKSYPLKGKTVQLLNIPIGQSVIIKKADVDSFDRERSRYTAVISKHRKKFNWKFKIKTSKKCITITKLK